MIDNYRYATLHTHSEYSNIRLIDSLNRIPEMIDYCVELGLSGIALTDHECLSGAVKFLKYYNTLDEEIRKNFKPMIGDEIYLVDEVKQKRMNHFILIAKDKIGFDILKKISSTAWENSYNKGKMTRVPITKKQLKEILEPNKGHLIASTACLGGEFPQLLLELVKLERIDADINEINKVKQKIVDFVNFCVDMFGKENFFFEIQPSKQIDQTVFNEKCKALSKAFDIEIIVTTDAHYLNESDKIIHSAFLTSKEAERETADFYDSTYLMSSQEIFNFPSINNIFNVEEMKHIFDNTNKIADMCEIYSLDREQDIPHVNREKELEELISIHGDISSNLNKYEHLRTILKEKNSTCLYWIYRIYNFLTVKGLLNDEYLSRIDLEAEELLGVSNKLGHNVFDYYVTMTKIMEICWNDANAIVGPGRGSVTGYLSAYCLEISSVDSIKYDLPHWRHLTKERPELPDIDFDTPASRRTNLLLATKNYFGKDNVLSIATFKTEGAKSAVLTACRGYRSEEFPNGVGSEVGDFLSSMIKSERGFQWSIKDTVEGNIEKDRKPVAPFVKEVNRYPGLLDIIKRIEGVISGRSIHASGVYIYNQHYLKYNAMMKSQNGQMTTQFDMEDSDYQGGLKFDYLTINALDIIQTCLNLLIKDGLVDEKPTLKETYDSILSPDVLVDNKKLWDHASFREILSCFQFDTQVGGDAITKIEPNNLIEAAHANSLMRLMASEKGGEMPIDKFVRYKNNIKLWYKEMKDFGLTSEEIEILERHLNTVYGVAATQEDMMSITMDKDISNFDIIQANGIRKAVAKKKADIMEKMKKEFFECCKTNQTSGNLSNYIWEKVILPQAGYSFSKLHTTAYTIIALQELTLFHNYPNVYWNTAVLTVNSASVEEFIDENFIEVEYDEDGEEIEEKKKSKAVQYGKIAKAIGEIINAGIDVAYPNINVADREFQPDAKNDRIYYSLKALAGVGDAEIDQIFRKRPFSSFEDYLEKTNIKKPATISLIKSGAFTEIENEDKTETMKKYIQIISEPKKKLTLQNFNGLFEKGLIADELEDNRKLYYFNKYIRQKQFKIDGKLFLDERAQTFLMNTYPDLYSVANLEEDNMLSIDEKFWKKNYYEKGMDPIRDWLKANQTSLLEQYNQKLFDEMWNKYCKGDVSKWEMDSMSFYWHEHELAYLNFNKYGISQFMDLPEVPEVDTMFQIKGRNIPLYKLTKIVGTCIDKQKTRGSFTLLTSDGAVVEIRLSNEHFALYNKQISALMPDGKKQIKERSWFTRGNKLMVVGFRRDNSFVPKKYKRSAEKHRLFLIKDVNDDGTMNFTSARWGEVE